MVVVVGLWAFLSSWNDYLLPLVVLQDETLQTVPLALAHFMGSVDTQYGLLAMGALLASAPILCLYGALYGIGALGVRRLRALQHKVSLAKA
jgi:ABC-type glycerol-3-phosphate transport system permease component